MTYNNENALSYTLALFFALSYAAKYSLLLLSFNQETEYSA